MSKYLPYFFFVVLASLLTAWTVMVTFWIIAAYAPQRFAAAPLGLTFPPGRRAVVLAASRGGATGRILEPSPA